jgi:hypothetical protein
MRASYRLIATSVALVLLGSTCGGDDDSGDAEQPNATDAPATISEPCPTTPAAAGETTSVPGSCGDAIELPDTTVAATAVGTGTYDFALTQPVPDAGGVQYQTAYLEIELVIEDGVVTGVLEGPTDSC